MEVSFSGRQNVKMIPFDVVTSCFIAWSAIAEEWSRCARALECSGRNIKWDHFDILASGKTDYHCKVKETLFIQEMQPALNVNVTSEKLLLYKERFSIVSPERQFRFETLKFLLQMFSV